ncbi:MAG: ABC transporter substrate-binding protein [Anaerolineales bacterium]|jgi:branched-chain amino acid transport system substrate-binding protein|nr:ABC transporter substrate-binding protein [Anaerolineales bacterium]MDP7345628.1 ABC transporter substrate-binding protein [Anaerolineales bacterium]
MTTNKVSGVTRRELLKLSGAAATAYAAGPLLSACGGAAAGPVKAGVLLPYSGIYAVLGESITEAMKMYLDEIGNEAGGRKIELITEDTEMTPDVAQQKARKLIEQDEVDLVAGIVSTGVLYGTRDYFDASKKLLICANAGGNKISRDMKTPYIWRASFTNWQPNWPLGSWAYENVAQKVFMSAPDYGAGHNMVDAFANSFQAAGGEILGTQFTPFPAMGDPAPFITEIQGADPPMVFCFYSGGAAVTFVQAYGEFGLSGNIPLVCAGFTVEEDVLPAQGEAALGAQSGLHWALLLDNAVNKKFTAGYKERAGKDANVFAVQGYDTGRVVAELLNAVQGDTSDVNKMIDVMPGISFDSPRGPFQLDAKSQNPTQHIYVRRVEDVGGTLHNVVIEDLGAFTDPGDDSLG